MSDVFSIFGTPIVKRRNKLAQFLRLIADRLFRSVFELAFLNSLRARRDISEKCCVRGIVLVVDIVGDSLNVHAELAFGLVREYTNDDIHQ